MPIKLKPSEDSTMFEWSPHEDEVSDEEMCEIFYAINKGPEDIDDPVFKNAYLKYLKTHKK